MGIPKLNEICDCCGGSEKQPILQLFDDKCFRVVEGDQVHGEFCLKDFAFPVDGYTCVGLNVDLNGGEMTLFDNNILAASPIIELEEEKLFVRGILLRIFYPTKDIDGEEVLLTDKKVDLYIENAEHIGNTYPLYDFFAWFTNPKSNLPQDLINKIKVTNPNSNYKIRVSGLVIYGKATKNSQ